MFQPVVWAPDTLQKHKHKKRPLVLKYVTVPVQIHFPNVRLFFFFAPNDQSRLRRFLFYFSSGAQITEGFRALFSQGRPPPQAEPDPLNHGAPRSNVAGFLHCNNKRELGTKAGRTPRRSPLRSGYVSGRETSHIVISSLPGSS